MKAPKTAINSRGNVSDSKKDHLRRADFLGFMRATMGLDALKALQPTTMVANLVARSTHHG